MWPWIQGESAEQWDFALWDSVFDAAARHGITIKATLTANSGPWWLGTPSVLHSHTVTLDSSWLDAQEAYISACVARYAGHPALGQWILWNEPSYALDLGENARSHAAREAWVAVLETAYDGNVSALNLRWRTGYTSFEEVPFAQAIAHPAHSSSHWRSWRPILDDFDLRAQLLEDELTRIATIVRRHDPSTELCVNPNQTLNNHAEYGYRLERLASTVGVLGASFHAPWSFADFAAVDDHTSLVVAGVSLLQNIPGPHTTEVTEVQTGNTFYAGINPLGVGRAEIASSYLAPLLAGAESVTGWCFNTRRPDFEAGEWGLLNDDDSLNERTEAISHVRDVLGLLDDRVGKWERSPNQARVLTSERSQAVQLAVAQNSDTPWSKRATAAIHGSALAVVELNRLGVRAGLAPLGASLPSSVELVVALDMIAWEQSAVEELLNAARNGATVLIDGTTGEFDTDILLHRPWPGHYAEQVGIRSLGLSSSVVGGVGFGVRSNGQDLGTVTGVRADVAFDSAEWSPVESLVYAKDSLPVVWERPWGAGRLLYSSASIATSMLEAGSPRQVASAVFALASDRIERDVRPLSPATTVLSVHGTMGVAHGIFAPEVSRRRGEPVAVSIEPGTYIDLWTGDTYTVPLSRVLRLPAVDGIVLLVQGRPTREVTPSPR